MLEFAYWGFFLLLPAPWLAWLLLPAHKKHHAVINVPRLNILQQPLQAPNRLRAAWFSKTILYLAWLALLTAAAQPQWHAEPIQITQTGRDLMLAMDLSGSMEETDFVINNRAIDRLTASKIVMADFIEKRQGDRLGLIVFGEQAYLQTPLTFDTQTVGQLMQETFIGLAGNRATAIGDAIGIAVKRLSTHESQQRILILVTDGANNAGALSPLKAAEIAANNNLKIYTIGIGADEQIISGFFGRQRRNPSVDLDEDTLTRIAELTGGQYFRARNTEELLQIYNVIDALEPISEDEQLFKPIKRLFYWPLSVAVLLLACLALRQVAQSGWVWPSVTTSWRLRSPKIYRGR